MSNTQKVNLYDPKPIELMTDEERDAYFMKYFGKTYDEFCKDIEINKDKPKDISYLIKD